MILSGMDMGLEGDSSLLLNEWLQRRDGVVLRELDRVLLVRRVF